MLDSEYFRTGLEKQVRELGAGACCVAVHLTDGTIYMLKGVAQEGITDSYVMLEVFPEEGVTKQSKQRRTKPGGTNEVFYDRVAIPYEHITRVFLTVAPIESVEEPSAIGFQPSTARRDEGSE